MRTLQEQATATADSDLPAPTKRTADHSRLSDAEENAIWSLHKAGKNQTEIAQAVKCHPSSVSRFLSRFTDTREQAKARTQAAALELAEAAIKGSKKAADDGKPEHALELLDRLSVAERRATGGSGQNVGFQVFIGMPAQPVGPDPVIDVSLSPSVSGDLHRLSEERSHSSVR